MTDGGRDLAEVMVDAWGAELSELDMATKLLALRLRRVAHHLERELRRELAVHDTEVWEMEMLLSLRQAPGHCRGAGALLRQAQVTSGAITNRVARLEERGWVRREVDPSDRRQIIVTLTEEGERHADQLVAIKTVAEQRLFASLDAAARRRIAEDLKSLLLHLEGPAAAAGGAAEPAEPAGSPREPGPAKAAESVAGP